PGSRRIGASFSRTVELHGVNGTLDDPTRGIRTELPTVRPRSCRERNDGWRRNRASATARLGECRRIFRMSSTLEACAKRLSRPIMRTADSAETSAGLHLDSRRISSEEPYAHFAKTSGMNHRGKVHGVT